MSVDILHQDNRGKPPQVLGIVGVGTDLEKIRAGRNLRPFYCTEWEESHMSKPTRASTQLAGSLLIDFTIQEGVDLPGKLIPKQEGTSSMSVARRAPTIGRPCVGVGTDLEKIRAGRKSTRAETPVRI